MYRIKAFTLIELLVVMAIILALSAMLFGMIGAGANAGEINATKALVYTVGATIDQFTHETGAVPLPTGSAADPGSGSWYPTENDGPWDKQQLWWRLNHKMTAAESKAMRDAGLAADLAADPYQSKEYMIDKYSSSANRYAAAKAILDNVDNAEVQKYQIKTTGGWTYSNSSGDVSNDGKNLSDRGKYKSWILNIKGTIAKDLAERQFMTFSCLDIDELGDARFLKDQTIVDAWENPLIYIAHSTPAVETQSLTSGYYRPIEAVAAGRAEMTDRNGDGVINGEDWDTTPPLADQIDHNGSGTADADDWSSILWNSRPGNGTGFFLASAGPDQLFNCIYTDKANDDNIVNSLGE